MDFLIHRRKRRKKASVNNQLANESNSSTKSVYTISFLICKGGVGKTTSSYFMAKKIAATGKKVLVIDSDPQANLTTAILNDKHHAPLSFHTNVLLDVVNRGRVIAEDIIRVSNNMHLIPSTQKNSSLDYMLRQKGAAVTNVRDAIKNVKDNYDYIIFDSAPALNFCNANIMIASDLTLMPISLDAFSMQALEQTMAAILSLEISYGCEIDKKILINNFDRKDKVAGQYIVTLGKKYNDDLMKTVIRRSSHIRMALSGGDDFFNYKHSVSKEDYENLLAEIETHREKVLDSRYV